MEEDTYSKRITLNLQMPADRDVREFLETKDNISGYLRDLVRMDMKKHEEA
jgi:hypothetical protein